MNIALIVIAILGCFVSTIIGCFLGIIITSGVAGDYVKEKCDAILSDARLISILDKVSREE